MRTMKQTTTYVRGIGRHNYVRNQGFHLMYVSGNEDHEWTPLQRPMPKAEHALPFGWKLFARSSEVPFPVHNLP